MLVEKSETMHPSRRTSFVSGARPHARTVKQLAAHCRAPLSSPRAPSDGLALSNTAALIALRYAPQAHRPSNSLVLHHPRALLLRQPRMRATTRAAPPSTPTHQRDGVDACVDERHEDLHCAAVQTAVQDARELVDRVHRRRRREGGRGGHREERVSVVHQSDSEKRGYSICKSLSHTLSPPWGPPCGPSCFSSPFFS